MQWHLVLAFMVAVTPITLIPGTSFTLVTQKVIAGSRRDGVLVTFGTIGGLMVHATFAGAGLSALVMASAEALTVVKVLGAAYLVWLGITTWRSANRCSEPRGSVRWRLPWTRLGGLGQGLWSNVLNPKAASVYLTLVPQFLAPDHAIVPQIATLAIAHAIIALVWLLFWTSMIDAARRTIDTPRFRRAVSRLSGGALILLGIRTATVR